MPMLTASAPRYPEAADVLWFIDNQAEETALQSVEHGIDSRTVERLDDPGRECRDAHDDERS